MFLRLCGPPSIPLSFTVAGVLPRWDAYRFRLATQPKGRTAGIHRLPCGLPGYLILFGTRTFELQLQSRYSELPAQSEFFLLSKHVTATPQIPPTFSALKETSSRCSATVEPRHFPPRLIYTLRSPKTQ